MEPDLQSANSQQQVLQMKVLGEQNVSYRSPSPGLLSDEEQEKMANIIDSLDLEDTIRCKARLYFQNEQSKLKRHAKMLDGEKSKSGINSG